METSNNPITPLESLQSSPANGSEQGCSLQRLCVFLLISNLFVCGALGLFLLRQDRSMGRQITEWTRYVSDFEVNAQPRVNWFVGSLQAFARTNADFKPILAKYNLLPTNAAPPAAPKAPAPKK